MKTARICEPKAEFLKAHPNLPIQRNIWGGGEELRIPSNNSSSGFEESYFFNEEGFLIGALFVSPTGHDLKPYPVLRRTLEQLKPDMEFYLSLTEGQKREAFDTSALYKTGDEKSTTQYVTVGPLDSSSLLLASVAIDPYEKLLNPYRQEFLSRVAATKKGGSKSDVQGGQDRERFMSLQQFARGEAAQLGYCGPSDSAVAATAYGRAIESGFTDKAQLSEAHHKLGLALKRNGQLEKARDAMQQSLVIYPNRPEVLNNLGDVYKGMGDKAKALAAFERAVTLRPNYPIARFNLAEALEPINVKRAIMEYETYLALGEGIPGEEERVARTKKRVVELGRP